MEHTYIHGWRVEGLQEAAIASGNPHRITFGVVPGPHDKDMHTPRFERLARAPIGSGHDVALRGVIVWVSLYIKQNIHKQLLRYHHVEVISSMSIENNAADIIKDDFLTMLIDPVLLKYLRETYFAMPREWLVDNMPAAALTGLDIVTNYAQLKTIYEQRKNHRNPGWKPIISWIKQLPDSHLITGEEKSNGNA